MKYEFVRQSTNSPIFIDLDQVIAIEPGEDLPPSMMRCRLYVTHRALYDGELNVLMKRDEFQFLLEQWKGPYPILKFNPEEAAPGSKPVVPFRGSEFEKLVSDTLTQDCGQTEASAKTVIDLIRARWDRRRS